MLLLIHLETPLNQIVLQGRPKGSKGSLNDPKAGQLPGLGYAVGASGGELIQLS